MAQLHDDFFLTPAEVADRYRISVAALANHRCRGTGLPFLKVNGSVLYRASDLLEAELHGSSALTLEKIIGVLETAPGITNLQQTVEHVQKELAGA